MYAPMPPEPTIISATIVVMSAPVTESRSPAMMSGAAAGTTTLHTMRTGGVLNVCAVSICASSMPRTAWNALSMTGQNAASAAMVIFIASSSPRKRIAGGISAGIGMTRKSCKLKSSVENAFLDTPIRMPVARPAMLPSANPTSIR